MYKVNPDISEATTLPASFYRDKNTFYEATDRLLSSTWKFIGDENIFSTNTNTIPFVFYDKVLNEPLLLTKNKNDENQCLSNVCTHRGNLLVENPGQDSNPKMAAVSIYKS